MSPTTSSLNFRILNEKNMCCHWVESQLRKFQVTASAINKHDGLTLQLVVGASAVLDRYGSVVDLIESDGFSIDAAIHVMVRVKPCYDGKVHWYWLIELPSVFRLQPDIVVTIEDNFETMATAIAASYMNIPLAHTMGGEVSGTIDEIIRHAVTKLAHLHLPRANRQLNVSLKWEKTLISSSMLVVRALTS